MARQAAATRTGGHLVAECLEALGAEVVFGVPGIHALPIWEGLRTSGIRSLGMRTELDAGFAADGYARVTGRPAPLLLSTGPGALISLAALMEAASSHVPVVAVASQIPRDLVGRGRGYLHELRDQLACFAPVVKWAARAESAETVPALLAEAWRRALTPPPGPVFVEIPVDLLAGETTVSPVRHLDGAPPGPQTPATEPLDEAARLLAGAERSVVWAGGGVLRAGGWRELAELGERLRAPVATTYMGKGAFPEDHPLAVGSGCDEGAFRELLSGADAVLCVGTELGDMTTGERTLQLPSRLVQIDAAPERIGASYPALGLVGDARATLAALCERIPARPADGRAERLAAGVRERIARGLEAQGRELERGLLGAIRRVLPRDAVHAWDMTVLAYWAAAHFPALAPRRFLYPLGSGSLGYALPSALGARAALPDTPALAVVGDGGFLYGLAELASACQHGLAVKLLVVDDGGVRHPARVPALAVRRYPRGRPPPAGLRGALHGLRRPGAAGRRGEPGARPRLGPRGRRPGRGRAPRPSQDVEADDVARDQPGPRGLGRGVHEKRIEIRWRDMDALGHVNHAVFLTYIEEARDEWLERVVGVHGSLWDYVLARVEIDFRNEIRRLDGGVIARCRLDRIGNSSVRTREELLLPDGTLAAEAQVVIVAWDREAGRPRPISGQDRAAFEREAAGDAA